MENEEIKSRKERIIKWFRNPYNLAIVGILLFAFALRLYYFILTKNQPLWWDEAEYMSTAKHWAFGVPFELNPQRPPLFQFLSALIFMAGLGELIIKFLLVILPSLFLVYAVYLLGKEMFDKKIGLIAALLTTVSWTLLFWSARFQPDLFSMVFQVLAILFMWKYWKEPKTKTIIFSAIFAALGFYFKVSALIVPVIFCIFILFKDRLAALKNKDYYIFAAVFLLVLVPYFFWASATFHNITAFKTGYTDAASIDKPFGWYTLGFFNSLTENILFILFIVGLVLALKFLLYLDILAKDKTRCFDSGLFSILSLIAVSAFYIFYIRDAEDRWVFLWLPFIFFFTGTAIVTSFEFLKKYNKILSVLAVVILLVLCVYMQLGHANKIINLQKESYLPVKEAAIWLKENSPHNASILTLSYTQTVYYSERNVTSFSTINTEKDFEDYINSNKPNFLEISAFETRANKEWLSDWLEKNQNKTFPVKVYYADSQRTQAILILYSIRYA
jgi:4-amino-4-deoxy-L-arabinose transferase-like glycosyltransferase